MQSSLDSKRIDQVFQFGDSVRKASAEASAVFIDRDDVLKLFIPTMVAGRHGLMIGAPGIAKSALIEFLARSFNVNYFRYLLDSDTSKDDLFGSLSSKALVDKDEYVRKWAGFSNAHLVFLDEPGKAPNSVLNLLLSALNERIGFSLYEQVPFPLHSCWAASNEKFDDNPAIWDRFHVRIPISDVSNDSDLWRIMTGDVSHSVDTPIDPAIFPYARTLVKEVRIATATNTRIRDLLMVVKTDVEKIIGRGTISSRRWQDALTVCAGNTVARGSLVMEPQDLTALIGFLWSTKEDYWKIRNIIIDHCAKESKELQDFKRKVKEIENRLNSLKTYETKPILSQIVIANKLWSDMADLNRDRDIEWVPTMNSLRLLINKYTGAV